MRNIYLLSLSFLIILSLNNVSKAQSFAWAKKMGANSSDEGRAIAVDAAGNVYTTGYFNGTVDFDPGAGVANLVSSGSDIFVSKLDAAGNFIWAKKLGGTGSEYGVSIAVDGSGNVLTTGSFAGTVDFDPGAGTFTISSTVASVEIFISKLDAAGNFVWAKSIGSFNSDISTGIATDATGNVYTTGYFRGTVDFDPGAGTFTLTETGNSSDIFINKLDASGNFVWAKRIGSGFVSGDIAYGIAVDASGNVLTTGTFYGTCDFDPGAGTFYLSLPGGGYNIFVSKLDASGNFVWAQAMGGGGYCEGYAITTDAAGNVYTTGYFTGISDFDPSAGTFTVGSNGMQDAFISKLDANGNFVWANGIGGPNNDNGTSITVSPLGNVYTAGSYRGASDFDPGVGSYSLTSLGSDDIFISALNSTGNFMWAASFGASGSDLAKSIAVDGFDNIHTTGSFGGTVDFDPSVASFNLVSAGSSIDIFVVKLSSTASTISETNITSTILAYPNPNNGAFTIQTDIDNNYNVFIYNSIGQLVKHTIHTNDKNEIDLSGFAKGFYSVVVKAKGNSKSIKIIVE